MLKKIVSLIILGIFFFSCSKNIKRESSLEFQEAGIYHEDNRRSFLKEESLLESMAEVSAFIVWNDQIKFWGKSFFLLKGKKLGDLDSFQKRRFQSKSLCPEVRFQNEYSYGFCSAFLIHPKIIVTAAHCLREVFSKDKKIGDVSLVFNTAKGVQFGKNGRVYPHESRERIKRILLTDFRPGVRDYAFLELEEERNSPLPYSLKNELHEIGDQLVMLGHPIGLTQKIAEGATLRDIYPHMAYSDLDGFGGDSGAMVVNFKRRDEHGRPLLLGNYIGGRSDFYLDESRQCIREKVYTRTRVPRLLERINILTYEDFASASSLLDQE